MVIRKTTKTLAALLIAVLLGCGLMLPVLAASGDITDYLREALQTDAASITLYTPTENFSSCGEILYSDETGAMQLAVSGEEVVPLQSAVVSTETVFTPSEEESDDAPAWDGETPYVKAGYVLVTLRAEGRDDYAACLAETYTIPAAERQAQREAEEAARMAQETETQTETGESAAETETDDPEPVALPVATAEPIVLPQVTEKKSLSDRLGELSNGALALLIAVMVLGVAVLCELALLVVYKRRAENVAKNYLRAKTALDTNKRELSAARSKNLRLERELMQEREKMAAVREQLEKMQNKRTKKTQPTKSEPEAPSPGSTDGYDLDYLNWIM